jgi:hypothetical protein
VQHRTKRDGRARFDDGWGDGSRDGSGDGVDEASASARQVRWKDARSVITRNQSPVIGFASASTLTSVVSTVASVAAPAQVTVT